VFAAFYLRKKGVVSAPDKNFINKIFVLVFLYAHFLKFYWLFLLKNERERERCQEFDENGNFGN